MFEHARYAKTMQWSADRRILASLLATSSPVLSKAISEGTLRIVPAYYDLASGEVNVLKD